MRLSMNILADWLKKYNPKTSIKSGGRVIRNVRPFSDAHSSSALNAYVGALDSSDGSEIMCMNRNDFIYVHAADTNEIINEIMDAFDYYNEWSDDIYQNISEMALDELLERASRAIPGLLIVADPSYYVLTDNDITEVKENDPILRKVAQTHIMEMTQIWGIEKDQRIRQNLRHAYVFDKHTLPAQPSVRNLFLEHQHVGWLILTGTSITPGVMDLQDELGDMIEIWIARHTAYQDRLNRNAIFYDILAGREVDPNKMQASLLVHGCHNEDDKMLYCIECPENLSGYTLLERVNEIVPESRNFVYDSHLICLFFGTPERRKKHEKNLTDLLGQVGGTCGASPVFKDIMSLKTQLEHAKASLLYAAKVNDSSLIVPFERAALFQVKNMLENVGDDWLKHPAMKILEEYDDKNNTELLNTLKVYLECERNYTLTAETLHIHRNTILYRITRINELTELDLDNPYIRLHLALAFLVS